MIGTDEMSSTGMDISESFRPEDLSKTDFFDFVTAPDMGIGIGVGVSLHTHHHSHARTTSGSMTHDGGGGGGGSSGGGADGTDGRAIADNGGSNNNDPTLQSYEFWHTDKEQSRLESNIFEDLDRYCWQQQQQAASAQQQQQQQQQTSTTHPASVNAASPNQHMGPNACQNPATTTSHTHTHSHAHSHTASSSTSGSISQPSSAGTVSSIDNTDGQIYTLTVLNGNEPWLKREPDTQLPSTLDLDSLLGNFSGYIKSEYPYDDSGFSTDGTKEANGEPNGISISQMASHHGMSNMPGGQALPSLVTTLSGPGSGGGGGAVTNATSISQQLAQFQNNNNDWHMADHNAEQNSAESLLRSALQGKGYSKGLHMQNGIALMPSSPSVKDEDMRRILFPCDTDALAFADSTLSTAQMFEDTQNAAHNAHLVQHSPLPNGPLVGSNAITGGGVVPSIMVDDMFLSLEHDYNDDYEKIKRLANEVQQFCNAGAAVDYAGNADVLMQISPTAAAAAATAQLQQMHSPAAAPSSGAPTQPPQPPPPTSGTPHMPLPQKTPKPQTLKPEVSASTSRISATSGGGVHKSTKKYKRLTSVTHGSNNNNNNNNSSVINHNSNNNSNNSNNNNGNVVGGAGNINGSSALSANNSSNNNNGNGNAATGAGASAGASSGSSTNSSNSPTHCNGGQRKERSLHYCSICSKGFKDKYSVNVHIRTHTGEKPFACSLCGKSFRQKAHLAKHYQTHMAQKNNGSVVKGGASKHHRNSASGAGTAAAGAATVPPHSRQLSIGGGGGGSATTLVSAASGGLAVGVGGLLSPVMSLSLPTGTSVLPPANGLLANR